MPGKWISLDRALLGATLLLQAGIIGWLGYEKWSERRAEQQEAIHNERPIQSRPHIVLVPPSTPPLRSPFNDPFFASASDMHRHMNQMMADALQSFEQLNDAMAMDQGWDALPASPTMDMRVLGDRYEVTFSLPGCNPSNVTVNLEGRLLTVASSSDAAQPHQRQFQRFQSRVQLPGPVGDVQKAKVEFTNGVLRLTIPRGTDANAPLQKTKLI